MEGKDIVIKHTPFKRDISRLPSEPPLNGVPHTAEESVFNDPAAVTASEAASQYMNNTTNSKQRDSIVADISQSDNVVQIMKYIKELSASSSERADKYDTFMAQIGKKVDAQRDRKNRSLLEKSELTIPDSSVTLVNRALRAAYPEYYGKVIPELHKVDLQIFKDDSIQNYLSQVGDEIRHPIMKGSRIVASDADFLTMPSLKEKPIFIRESFVRSMDTLSPLQLEALFAYFFIHEDLHRAPTSTVLTDDDAQVVLDVGFENIVHEINSTSDQVAKEELTNSLKQLKQYVNQHNLQVEVEGTIVKVYCEDEDGEMKQVSVGGYDLNEAIIEFLSSKPREVLYGEMRKSKDPEAEQLAMYLSKQEGIATSNIQTINRDRVIEKLGQLGLTTPSDIIEAYVQGDIPLKLQKTQAALSI